jgi:hypothetical protein
VAPNCYPESGVKRSWVHLPLKRQVRGTCLLNVEDCGWFGWAPGRILGEKILNQLPLIQSDGGLQRSSPDGQVPHLSAGAARTPQSATVDWLPIAQCIGTCLVVSALSAVAGSGWVVASLISRSLIRMVGSQPCSGARRSAKASRNARWRCRPPGPGNSGGRGVANRRRVRVRPVCEPRGSRTVLRAAAGEISAPTLPVSVANRLIFLVTGEEPVIDQ